MICGFLLAGSVSAMTPEEQAISDKNNAIFARARTLLLEAESRAMERCDATRIVVSLPTVEPQYDTNNNRLTWVDKTYEETVTIEWNGACVDGKREGEGVLNWVEVREFGPGDKSVSQWRSEGRFVKGQRLGLWCWTKTFQRIQDGKPSRDRSDSGCWVLAGHTNPLTDNYRKLADGRWQELSGDSPTGSSLAAGTLEAQSAKVLAAAAAGKTDLKVALVVQNKALDDLVSGSKIVLAPSTTPLSLKDKRVAIVLSSQSVSELERFRRERQILIDASAGLSGKAATERAKFIQASDPNRLLINIIKLVKKYAKDAQPADDLTGLQKGSFDYALVVDWKSMTRFDLLGKYYSFTQPQDQGSESREKLAVAGESLGGFLVNRDLKALKYTPGLPRVSTRLRVMFEDPSRGDEIYMRHIAKNYADSWGDDLGYPNSVTELGYMLQGKQ